MILSGYSVRCGTVKWGPKIHSRKRFVPKMKKEVWHQNVGWEIWSVPSRELDHRGKQGMVWIVMIQWLSVMWWRESKVWWENKLAREGFLEEVRCCELGFEAWIGVLQGKKGWTCIQEKSVLRTVSLPEWLEPLKCVLKSMADDMARKGSTHICSPYARQCGKAPGEFPGVATTNCHTLDECNRNLFFCISGDQKFKIKVLAGPCSLWSL